MLSFLLPPDAWENLASDLRIATHHLEAQIQVKFDFLNKLPWRLAVMAYHNEHVAREQLQCEYEKFQTLSPEKQACHHRLVIRVFQGMREDVEKFLRGSPLCRIPSLVTLATTLSLVPCTERSTDIMNTPLAN